MPETAQEGIPRRKKDVSLYSDIEEGVKIIDALLRVAGSKAEATIFTFATDADELELTVSQTRDNLEKIMATEPTRKNLEQGYHLSNRVIDAICDYAVFRELK